jgi:hypothetical protein
MSSKHILHLRALWVGRLCRYSCKHGRLLLSHEQHTKHLSTPGSTMDWELQCVYVLYDCDRVRVRVYDFVHVV